MNSLKIIFAGTPKFASCHLKAILDSTHQIICVYTQPDRPSGRGKKLNYSEVKQLAIKHDLVLQQPSSLKDEEVQKKLATFKADLIVVVAYGLILPKAVLEIPKYGCINVHGSILPKWRGAAPIQRAIESGDTETGITIMKMDTGLDTGDMLLKKYCKIEQNDNSSDVHDKLIKIGKTALIKVINQISEGKETVEKQNNRLASYAHKISKDEAKIDWSESSEVITRKIRAFNPWPIMYTQYKNKNIRVWQASILSTPHSAKKYGEIVNISKEGIDVACGKNVVRLEIIQSPSSKAMTIRDWLNGNPLFFSSGDSFLNA